MRAHKLLVVGSSLLMLMVGACSSDDSKSNNGTSNNGATNNGATNNGATNNGVTEYTYYEHVAPVLEGRCASCHTDGGIGPFSLESYADAQPIATLLASVVEQRTMPPFLPAGECNEFQHDPRLTGEQVDAIVGWAKGGALEGDPSNQGASLPELGFDGLTRIDKTLSLAEPYTPRQSPDDYRCFVVDLELDTDQYVTGFGVDPDQDSIVHHVIAFYVTPDLVAAAEAADAAEEGPGYTCFGGPGFGDIRDTKWLGSWAPGGLASDFPAGTGIPVEAGSKIVLQVHYNTLSTDPVPDQTSVNFKLDATVEKEAEFFLWANPAWLNGDMEIAAGEADAQHSFAFDPTPFLSGGKPIKYYGGFIHMHTLGKAARLFIQRGGDVADEDCLMDIPNYDFNWQSGVRFMEPKVLNPGDRLVIRCHWDNTLDNQVQVDGAPLPVKDVNWGDGTTDEMCLGVMYATIED